MSLIINADTLPRYQTRVILGMVSVLMLAVSAFFIFNAYRSGQAHIQQQWQTQLERSHQSLRDHVDATLDYIEYVRQQTESVLKRQVRDEVRQAMTLARSIYAEEQIRNPDDSESTERLIREALRDLRFFDGRGYIFIDTLEGQCVLLPTLPSVEGQSLYDNQDDTGHYIMRGLIDAALQPRGTGYSRYRWYAPDYPDEMREKIAYVELFEPLNWIIGSGDYLYQVENDLKQQTLSRLQTLRLDNEGYIAVLKRDGQVLLSPSRPDTEGLSLDELDEAHQRMVSWLIAQASPEGRFVEYQWYGPNSNETEDKLALVQLVPEWDWVLVAGVYQKELTRSLDEQKRRLESGLHKDLQALVMLLALALVVAMGVTLVITRWLRVLMKRYQRQIDDQREQLQARSRQLQLAGRVFESAGEGAMISDANNRIMAVNPAFCRITGYSADEVVGQTPALLASGRHSQAFFKEMWKKLHEDHRWQGEVWNRRRNGEIYPQWLSITLVVDEEGQPSNYVAMLNDITERKAAEDQVRYLSDFDALTDLPNRQLLRERTRQAIDWARSRDQKVALVIFDLDRFKNINDTLGHGAGDSLLQMVSQRLSNELRGGVTLSRIGGDEFVALLSNTTALKDLNAVVTHCLAQVSRPLNLDGHSLVVTASAGVAVYPDDGDNFETLLKNADTALYYAKGQGRNNFQCFTSSMNEKVSERLLLETGLRDALLRDEFELYYQPQYDFARNRLSGCEALIRWNSPSGMVMPDRFIPLAEETGLIISIGAWVLEEACRQGELWNRDSVEPLSVAVNVSAVQFRPELVDEVRNVLDSTGFDPELLVLEVTESVLMSDVDSSVLLLQQLRDLGIRIALDDFGTGYASLAYLKRFVLDKLKIDRAFIMGIPEDRDDVAITSSIIDIARHLNIMTVAEGVETEAHCEFLRAAGCNLAQGYYFDKPLSADEFTQRLK
ncbi:bifunctional diguanylate cyclase/phosphodiesterase [Marinobacterium sediminicola]|uniref:Diguanylate cyclase/phosphodiesterase with PAS/PAC sensor(S) n=1 Tax=Marinobacterium sediminicola TaxID=518898 RepID=A0ABY1RZ66_9GAMM|nr:cache domain-containing protein [Marinobacterium sediminicola]ULG68016.1 cache domain-containing protein [Marinobacterium sediminicola]SMR73474.1 diguanylate cyclase/phosphodiesterase with PAS/PAC sensor(s) [Marinobacterium sediminicola]